MSPPPPVPTVLGSALRTSSSPGTPLPRPPAAGRAGQTPRLLLALVCAGYAIGSACGWGSDKVALFMGAAMSITAFPVLARILKAS